MYFQNLGIGGEYRRIKDLIGPDDPYQSSDTIGMHDVLAAHFLIVDYFAEMKYGIGGVGPRSMDLLHSALSRQFTSFGGVRKWNNLYEICATLLFGLIMNHPFHDANKRTALLSILSLLHRKNKVVDLPQKKLDGLVVAVAGNSLPSFFEKDARYRDRIKSLSDPHDADGIVRIVSDFLRRNTRHKEDSSPSVTYAELDRALRQHGFALRNPNGNYIKVVRIEPARRGGLLGIGAKPEREIFLTQIGFPNWKDQVRRPAIKTVREATGLTAENGYDAKVLFEGAEPLNSLISEYAEPLKRLSNK